MILIFRLFCLLVCYAPTVVLVNGGSEFVDAICQKCVRSDRHTLLAILGRLRV